MGTGHEGSQCCGYDCRCYIQQSASSISLDGQPRRYQSTAKHNFGKSSAKDHQLTATAYRNGYCKSAIGMTLSSDPRYDNTVDLSISSAKHAKIYFNKDQSKMTRKLNVTLRTVMCLDG